MDANSKTKGRQFSVCRLREEAMAIAIITTATTITTTMSYNNNKQQQQQQSYECMTKNKG